MTCISRKKVLPKKLHPYLLRSGKAGRMFGSHYLSFGSPTVYFTEQEIAAWVIILEFPEAPKFKELVLSLDSVPVRVVKECFPEIEGYIDKNLKIMKQIKEERPDLEERNRLGTQTFFLRVLRYYVRSFKMGEELKEGGAGIVFFEEGCWDQL